MPFQAYKPDPRCVSCKLIASQAGEKPHALAPLYKRYEQVAMNTMSMKDLERWLEEQGTPISYKAILTHSKKHQKVHPKRIIKAKVEKETQAIQQQGEEKRVATVKHHSDRRSAALDKLDEMLQNGTLKGATYTAMAAFLKQEADIEEKAKDRTFEMQKLFASYVANPLPKPRDGYRDALEGELVSEGELVEPTDSPSGD